MTDYSAAEREAAAMAVQRFDGEPVADIAVYQAVAIALQCELTRTQAQSDGLREALKALMEARWMVSIDWAPTSLYEAVEEQARAAITAAKQGDSL